MPIRTRRWNDPPEPGEGLRILVCRYRPRASARKIKAMPDIVVNGARIHYEDSGAGPGQTIVFAHGLLWGGWMFEAQAAALATRYRCIRFDFRGQGKSEITGDGYDMETLTGDAVALIEALNIGPVHFAGLSMGGFIGMRLGARRPDLVRSLTLMETSADPEPAENVPKYRKLAFVARWIGLKVVSKQVMPIMFGRTFLSDPARAADRKRFLELLVGNHRVGITRAVHGVIDRAGVYDEIASIRCPTLVIVGDEDVATVPAKAERLAARIPGATLVRIPRAGHSSTVEEPAAVTAAMSAFLTRLS